MYLKCLTFVSTVLYLSTNFAICATVDLQGNEALTNSAIRPESVPEPGQLNRYRAAPRDSLLSLVPVDGAEFIPGQYFDISIELHSVGKRDQFPSLKDLKATINGMPLETFFPKQYSPVDTWNFDHFVDMEARINKNVTPVAVSRLALRSVQIPKAGSYKVELSIGKEKVVADWTVREVQPASLKNLVLFIGDGMAVGITRLYLIPIWYLISSLVCLAIDDFCRQIHLSQNCVWQVQRKLSQF